MFLTVCPSGARRHAQDLHCYKVQAYKQLIVQLIYDTHLGRCPTDWLVRDPSLTMLSVPRRPPVRWTAGGDRRVEGAIILSRAAD